MNVQIFPSRLCGTVTPPVSKSMAHRAVLAAMLSGSSGPASNQAWSEDILATKRCVAALKQPGAELPLLDCGESGSTLRFLIPVALALRGGGRFTGRGRLMERPQQPYFDLFAEKGISYCQQDGVLTVEGTLTPGVYALPGNVSSQFVTGLLFALPLLQGNSVIRMTSPLESRAYVDMTLQVLAQSGIRLENREDREFLIPGPQVFRGQSIPLEADWSQAGFWFAARFSGQPLEILDLNRNSTQGDRVVESLFHRLRAPGRQTVDVSGCPDLLPPLAVMAACRQGVTVFSNAARLRMKESDRLATVHAMLEALGGRTSEGPDSLTVDGGVPLTGGTVDGANDHRIVMAAAIAAAVCQGPTTILGAEAVNKSYPSFWEEYQRLGGNVHVL